MNHLDILIPFGLPPAELAADLTRNLAVPSYATLLARSKSVTEVDADAFARSLPHEQWLARQFGLANQNSRDSLPIASTIMQNRGIASDSGFWFVLHPAHLHIARDHLVLTDPRNLLLNDNESRTLFESVIKLFEEDEKTLAYGDARTWFLRADEWTELSTSTPSAASGHNIDIWMPRGHGEREWRKLLNEVQMTWHAHPLNAEREMLGQSVVNSLWLWGGAHGQAAKPQSKYEQIFNPPAWIDSRNEALKATADVSDVFRSSAATGLLMLEHLTDAAMAGDWSNWLSAMHQLEREWMVPLLDALRSGKIAEIRLILSHNTRLIEVASSKNSVKKFWIKPSLSALSR